MRGEGKSTIAANPHSSGKLACADRVGRGDRRSGLQSRVVALKLHARADAPVLAFASRVCGGDSDVGPSGARCTDAARATRSPSRATPTTRNVHLHHAGWTARGGIRPTSSDRRKLASVRRRDDQDRGRRAGRGAVLIGGNLPLKTGALTGGYLPLREKLLSGGNLPTNYYYVISLFRTASCSGPIACLPIDELSRAPSVLRHRGTA